MIINPSIYRLDTVESDIPADGIVARTKTSRYVYDTRASTFRISIADYSITITFPRSIYFIRRLRASFSFYIPDDITQALYRLLYHPIKLIKLQTDCVRVLNLPTQDVVLSNVFETKLKLKLFFNVQKSTTKFTFPSKSISIHSSLLVFVRISIRRSISAKEILIVVSAQIFDR